MNYGSSLKSVIQIKKSKWACTKLKNIANANTCTIAVNPKEYFEKLKNRLITENTRESGEAHQE